MELVGETCKLCLKFLQGANLASLNETMLGKLEFLQMNLDQSIEESNTVCKECEEKIENAFDFKSCLVNTESCLVPYVSQDKTQKVNLRLIIEKDGPSTSTAESFGEKEVCRLCKSFFNASSVISLSKLLKDDSMSEIFQGHIPEMDLDVTENPMVCESCQKSLVSFSTLITSWSIANGWNDDEDFKDDNFEMLQVKKEVVNDFSDSNTNSSTVEISGSARNPNNRLKQCTAATQIKTETGISDSSASVPVPNTPIKSEVHEEITDTPMEEIQLKSEEVDIKDEDGFGNIGTRASKILDQTNQLLFTGYKCNQCSYETKLKQHLARHSLVHKSLNEVETFRCGECSFVTKRQNTLKQHVLLHKNINEVRTFKCTECSYVARQKYSLTAHILTHRSLYEVNTFKCDECSYETKHKYSLKSHKLRHKPLDQVKRFHCEKCPFVTIRKCILKQHASLHKSIDDVVTFKCEECSYTARQKTHLNAHIILIHKALHEVEAYKCNECSFETKLKYNLINHALVHKSLNEVKTFCCEICNFVTKRQSTLKKHILLHKNINEVKTFKCAECPYVARQKVHLTMHILTHKNLNEVNTFKCQECAYETKNKYSLKTHRFVHDKLKLNEMKKFKCEECPYATWHKGNLNQHYRVHRSEKVTFKCDECSYAGKSRASLKKHALLHKGVNDQTAIKCE